MAVLELDVPATTDPGRVGPGGSRQFTLRLRNAGHGRLWVNKRMAIGVKKQPASSLPQRVGSLSEVWFDLRVGTLWIDPFDCKVNSRFANADDFQLLEPGESVSVVRDLHCLSALRRPGTYVLVGHYRDDTGAVPEPRAGATYLGGEVTSAPVKIVVGESFASERDAGAVHRVRE